MMNWVAAADTLWATAKTLNVVGEIQEKHEEYGIVGVFCSLVPCFNAYNVLTWLTLYFAETLAHDFPPRFKLVTSILTSKIHCFLQPANFNQNMIFISVSLLQGLYTEILRYISPLTHYSPLWMCLYCLFCSHCASSHSYHRGQNHLYSIYIMLKPLNIYITWEPLKDSLCTHSAFSSVEEINSHLQAIPFLPGQKNWLNSVLDFEQKRSIFSSPLPPGYS